MDNFTVKIYFKNSKVKILKDVNTLSYSSWFIDNKWGLSLEIGQSINSNPHYYTFNYIDFDKVIILNRSK